MKLGIKYSFIGKVFIIAMLVVHARYFYLIDISYNRTLLMAYFAIASVFFCGISLKKSKVKEMGILYGFIIIWMLSFAYSLLNYNCSVGSIYEQVIEFLSIFAAIAVYIISKKEDSVQWIENIIVCIGTIVATIVVIQGLLLTPRGITIFHIQYSIRLEGIRFVNSTEPIMFAAIFTLADILTARQSLKGYIIKIYILVVSTIELVFIAKTRALLIIYFITIVIMIWSKKSSATKKEIVRKTVAAILICGAVIGALNTNISKAYFNEYIESLNTQYDTVSIRNEEVKYAIELLGQNPVTAVLGTGFVPETNETLNYSRNTIKGLRTDIGVVGFINQFGVLGLIWILLIIINATKVLLKNLKETVRKVDYIGLYSIFILGMPTLFLFNGERLVYFPIWLGIMLYYKYSGEKN